MKNKILSRSHLKDLSLSIFSSLSIFLVALLILCSAGSARAQSSINFVAANYERRPTGESIRSMEHIAFDLVNNERVKHGNQRLTWSDQAAAAARAHSDDMVQLNYFSHADTQGRHIGKRAENFGLGDWRWIGENIAWLSGDADPARIVVENWMNSSGHRENILNTNFRESGMGLAVSNDGKYYFTQVFVSRK